MVNVPRLEAPNFYFPEAISAHTPAGARILLVPMATAMTVSIGVFVREGTATEPISGMSSVVAAMLPRGTQKRTHREFTSAIDRLGATVQTNAARRSIGITITGLPDHWIQLIELAAECITAPAFAADEFDKVRQQTLASFPLLLADSSYRARRIFHKLRYPNHPASRPLNGTPASIASLQRDDVAAWYNQLIRSSAWTILMIGNFDADAVRQLVASHFSQLGSTAEQQQLPQPPEPPSAIGIGQSILTEQVELRLGHSAVGYTSADYPAALLVATAFAGHFRSRVNMILRERQGLTYGAFGVLSASKRAGTFAVSTSTTPDNVSRAIELLRTEWQRLASAPLTNDEIHQARQYLFGSFWRSVETPDAIAAMAIDLALNDLPTNFYNQLLTTIDALDASALASIQQRVFDPARLIIAAVGDLERLFSDLSPLGKPEHVLLEEEQQ
ncbi:MAG: insulinase family protein [Chlorobi bacterium]|nr:insulinase family protein [Chlorobiota bacterium]